MMGCARNIGCVVMLLAALAVGWFLHDRFVDRPRAAREAPVRAGPLWEPLTPEGAARARQAVARLARQDGPVFATLSAGDLASHVFTELAKQLPRSAENIRAAVIGERMYIRATVRLSELGGEAVLGPLAGFVGERDTVTFGGSFAVLRPGLAEYRVQEIRIRDFAIPQRLIPRLLRQVSRGTRPEGLSDNGLPVVIPLHIADVRIGNGRITLYRNVP